MDAHSDNPSDNAIGQGVSEEALYRAIQESGYPFQAVVAERLQHAFANAGGIVPPFVQEEWSYIDSDTGTVRSIDALVEVRLPCKEGARIRPIIDLLVECKQIELPTVFFIRSAISGFGVHYPRLTGHPHPKLAIRTSRKSDTRLLDLFWVLGFGNHEFNNLATPAVSMARIHRKGNGLELSGQDTYPNIVRPLLKATDHFLSLCKPNSALCYFDLRMVVSVAVLRGPMVGVAHTEEGVDHLTYIPWARLHRLEPSNREKFGEYGEPKPIDIVHAGYLDSYSEHLLAFARLMAERIEKLTTPIIWGEGRIAKGQEEALLFKDISAILQPTVTKRTFEQEMDERMYKAHRGDYEA